MKAFFTLNLGFLLLTSMASANVAVMEALSTRVTTAVSTANISRVNVQAVLRGATSAAIMAAGANRTVVSNLEAVVSNLESVARSNDAEFNGLSKERRVSALVNAYVASINSQGNDKFLSILNGDFKKMVSLPVNESERLTNAGFQKVERFFELVAQGSSLEDAAQTATGGSLEDFANACKGAEAASGTLR